MKVLVDVTNDGSQAGSFSTILNVKESGAADFKPVAVRDITLGGGDTGTVSFFLVREVQGTYQVQVEGRRGELLRGRFDVFTTLGPLLLALSDLVIEPSAVAPGERVTITAFVENRSNVDGRTELDLRINGVLADQRSVFVPAGGREQITFTFVPPAEGTFTVDITDPQEILTAVTGEITVAVPVEPARFITSPLTISPVEVAPGEQVTVSFDLSNLGSVGDHEVILLLNGVRIDSRVVTVEELETETVVFTLTAPDQPGDYTVEVDGVTASFRVVRLLVPVPRVVSVTTIPGRVQPGASITIAVDLVNDFNVEARRTLTVVLDGRTIEEREVVLGAGQASRESFTFAAPDAIGIHVVELDGQVREFEVVARIVEVVLNLVVLDVSPSEADPGQLVTITATLRNSGEELGQTDVILKIRGLEVERKTVVVPGLSDAPVTFTLTRAEEGDYAVQVEVVAGVDVRVLTGSFRVVPGEVVRAPANLISQPDTLTITPEKLESGEPVVVQLDVTNVGGLEGSRILRLIVDGKEIEVREITVGPGETLTVFFARLVERSVGTHTVQVDGKTAEFTVTKPASLAVSLPLLVIFALTIAFMAFLVYMRATVPRPPVRP